LQPLLREALSLFDKNTDIGKYSPTQPGQEVLCGNVTTRAAGTMDNSCTARTDLPFGQAFRLHFLTVLLLSLRVFPSGPLPCLTFLFLNQAPDVEKGSICNPDFAKKDILLCVKVSCCLLPFLFLLLLSAGPNR
jgi:hypothetical protein